LKAKGLKGWLKGFTEPVTLLTPINLIGEVANPISLSFRLMGNVLAGTIIMALYYGMLPMLAYIISPALHFYFDVFAGVLQSFIFVMLSMIYVSGAME
ncbi:MAG: F0F1 ATP synthase subunit A, partial [Clostridia bacterium]